MFTSLSPSHAKHKFKLPHLHILKPGPQIINKVQLTAAMQMLRDFACVSKGCYRNRGTFFILVFIKDAALIS